MLGVERMLKCNLKEIIKRRGLKQTFLADELGVSKQVFSTWTTGKSKPSLEVAYKIADKLDCSITDIWEYEEDKEE